MSHGVGRFNTRFYLRSPASSTADQERSPLWNSHQPTLKEIQVYCTRPHPPQHHLFVSPCPWEESAQSSSDHSFTDSHRSARIKTEFVVNIKLLMTSFCTWESVESSNKDQDITDWLCFSLFPVSVCAANPRDSSQSSISQIWIMQSCFIKVFM